MEDERIALFVGGPLDGMEWAVTDDIDYIDSSTWCSGEDKSTEETYCRWKKIPGSNYEVWRVWKGGEWR